MLNYCFFLHDRTLLVELSRCAWQSLKAFLHTAVPEPTAIPAAVVSTETFGDFPERFHPHLHVRRSPFPKDVRRR